MKSPIAVALLALLPMLTVVPVHVSAQNAAKGERKILTRLNPHPNTP
jgi:hypothetical protein